MKKINALLVIIGLVAGCTAGDDGTNGEVVPVGVTPLAPGAGDINLGKTAMIEDVQRLSVRKIAELPRFAGVSRSVATPSGRPSLRFRKLADGLDSLLVSDGSPHSRAVVDRNARFHAIRTVDDQVQVVIHFVGSAPATARGEVITIGSVEVRVESRRESRIQGWIDVVDLAQLDANAAVLSVTKTRMPKIDVTSEGVAVIGAQTMFDENFRGAGIKIGIIDIGFSGYDALMGTELPMSVTTMSFYAGGDITGGGEVHGTGVAEIIYDVAPDSLLYLTNVDSADTFLDAVDYLLTQNVNVISTSLGSYTWEGVDGTGPTALKGTQARNAGTLFFAAAGNSGDAHYRATFDPAVADPTIHQFDSKGSQLMFLAADETNIYYIPAETPLIIDMTWDDWGANNGTPQSTVDYNLWLLLLDEDTDPANPGWAIVAQSETVQDGSAYPHEYIGVYAPIEAVYAIAVVKTAETEPSVPFDLYATNVWSDVPLFEATKIVPAQSVGAPCVGENVSCVGAVSLAGALMDYSSRGPAHPRAGGAQYPKPDFMAPSGVSTSTYGATAFTGTSASVPHAAGLAALFMQMTEKNANSAETAMIDAALDMTPAGYDTNTGYGIVQGVPCIDGYCRSDGLACTDEECDPDEGCGSVANGVGCFIAGACVAEATANPANACQKCDQTSPTGWSNAEDGTACASDSNPCTNDVCMAGVCSHTSVANGTACADDSNDCTSDSCQAGVCEHAPLANGTACTDDGLTCTADSCQSGVCSHGTITTGCLIAGTCYASGALNPDNHCQLCAPAYKTSWTSMSNGSPCEDGLYCTANDSCQSGTCLSGLPRDCSVPGDSCNTFSCDNVTSRCITTPKADGTACTSDGNSCTTDACLSGVCVYNAVPNDCGSYVCGASPSGCHQCGTCPEGFGCDGGQCSDLCAGVNCLECQECSAGSCVAIANSTACTSDGNVCTDDVCSAGSCVHSASNEGGACNDASACTRNDKCLSGICTSMDVVVCSAIDDCHGVGECDPATGECSTPALENGTPCSSDDNECTIDRCSAAKCAHDSVASGVACDDEDLCTQTDSCKQGVCVGDNPVECPDPAECHSVGVCEAATGLCSDPLEADGVLCSDDGNDCTRDQCLTGTCDHPAREDGIQCQDDGFACTSDTCSAGECAHPVMSGCLIDDSCIADLAVKPDNDCQVCAHATSATDWSNVVDGTACDDGLFCTSADNCATGACVGGGDKDCTAEVADDCNSAICDEERDLCVALPKDQGTTCGDVLVCIDGIVSLDDSCDANGNCVDAGTIECSPYTCADETTCEVECIDGTECGDGFDCYDGVCRINTAPVASAGADQVVDESVQVTLDGRASSDDDSDALTWAWAQVEGPSVTLDSTTSSTPVFTSPTVTEGTLLAFELVVNDGWLDSVADRAEVTVTNSINEAPTASAGNDFEAEEGAVATLDGTNSSDPNNDEITYLWAQNGGVAVTLDDATAVSPTFTAPDVDVDEVVTFSLVVNDGWANSAPDTVGVTIKAQSDVVEPVPDVSEGVLEVTIPPQDNGSGADTSVNADNGTALDIVLNDVAISNDTGTTSGSGDGGCNAGSSGHEATWFLLAMVGGIVLFMRRKTARVG